MPTLRRLLVILACGAIGSAHLAADDAITELHTRLRQQELTVNSADGAAGFRDSLRADGSWADINYQDRRRVIWSPEQHLNRMRAMTIAWGRPGLPTSGDTALLDAVRRSLTYWMMVRPSSDNWYKNDIGQQLRIGPILLIAGDVLPPDVVADATALLNDPAKTGTNRVWLATQTIWRGVLTRRAADIDKGAKAIRDVLVITDKEGIQADMSFHQHGPQLHLGQYGTSFLNDQAEWADMLHGLPWAYPAGKIALMGDYLLHGQRWALHGAVRLPGNSGRAVSRPYAFANQSSLAHLCTVLARMDPDRSAEYLAFRAQVQGEASAGLVGSHHFWRSDYFTHHRPGWALAVSMTSTRIRMQECINDENLLGLFYSQGATWLQRSGDEYAEIWPILDWSRIPGTTVRVRNPTLPKGDQRGGGRFVGGVSDGHYGLAVYHHLFDGVDARKAVFAFADEVVLLGAGISAPTTATSPQPVITTLDQQWLRGPVTVGQISGEASILDAGQTTKHPQCTWVHHAGHGYIFPQGAAVTASTVSQTGSWKRINAALPSTAITGSVFRLWLDHGVAPAAASYACIRLPGADAAATAVWSAAPTLAILANTATVQAVRHPGLARTLVAFHAAARIELPDGRWLAADQPCLVVWNEGVGLTVARPDEGGAVQVTLGDGTHQLAVPFTLPAAPYRGRPVTVSAVLAAGGGENGDGEEEEADPGDPEANIEEIPVDADATVRAGMHANTTFGSTTTLEIKNEGATNPYTRESWLRFACADLGDVEQVDLVLVPTALNADASTTVWEVALATDAGDDWDESHLTWEARPTSMAGVATTFSGDLGVGVARAIDITPLMQHTLTHDPARLLTLRLRAITMGSKRQMSLASREHATLPGPKLVVRLRIPAGDG